MSRIGRRILLTVLLSIALGATLFTLAQAQQQVLHRVPVEVVAPLVVGQPLAAQLDRKHGDELQVTAVADETEALGDLRRGRTKAVLVLDLATTTDTLVVADTSSKALGDAIADRVKVLEEVAGRSVIVRHGEITPTMGEIDATVIVAILAGLLFVLFISLQYGPVAHTLRLGARRVWVLMGTSLAVGLLLAIWISAPAWAVIGVLSLVVLASALFTTAVASVFGWAGEAIAAVCLFLMALPLITLIDAELLAWPLSLLHPHGIAGAGATGITAAIHHQDGLPRSVLVLLGWILASVSTNLIARRLRPGQSSSDVVQVGLGRWRLRTGLAVLGVVLLIVLGTKMMTTVPTPQPRAEVGQASTLTCTRTGPIRGLDDLNRVVEKKWHPAFMGGDVGAEALLSDGRRVWVFGDTLRNPKYDGHLYVRNSMLISTEDCLDLVVPTGRGALIPDRDAQVGYWPMSVVSIPRPGYDFVLVGAQRVRSAGTGAFDFENLGPALAVFVVPAHGVPQLVQVQDLGKDSVDRMLPTWGAALAVSDDWVYLYGTARSGDPGDFGFALKLARARVDNILDTSTWSYWTGTQWAPRESAAHELIAATGGVSQTLSVFAKYDGGSPRWYALSKADEFLGTDLKVWPASRPNGPFGPGVTVAQLPSDLGRGALAYMPLAHPDLFPEPGSVVVSYSRNVTDGTNPLEDPFRYRIRFLRVPLPGSK